MIIRVETLEDERLAAYVSLTEVQLRNRLEPEKGIFIAESEKVIIRALDAGYEPLSAFDPRASFAAQCCVDRAHRDRFGRARRYPDLRRVL